MTRKVTTRCVSDNRQYTDNIVNSNRKTTRSWPVICRKKINQYTLADETNSIATVGGTNTAVAHTITTTDDDDDNEDDENEFFVDDDDDYETVFAINAKDSLTRYGPQLHCHRILNSSNSSVAALRQHRAESIWWLTTTIHRIKHPASLGPRQKRHARVSSPEWQHPLSHARLLHRMEDLCWRIHRRRRAPHRHRLSFSWSRCC